MLDPHGSPLCPTCSGDALDHALRSRNVTLTKRGATPAHDFVQRGDTWGVDGCLQTWQCAYCNAAFTVPERASESTMAERMERAHRTGCPLPVTEGGVKA